MSFIVYLDESGTTDPSACVVAGYGASSLKWSQFSRSWRRILLKYRIAEFHAEPFFKKNRLGLSTSNADDLLEKLIATISSNKPALVGTAVAVADFLALPEAKRKYLTGGKYYVGTGKVRGGAAKTAFHIAIQNTLIQATKLAPSGEKVDFICDEQKQYCPYVVERFNIIKRDHPNLPLGEIGHRPSKDISPLQAADLACYAAFQFTKERLRTGKIEASGLLARLITEKNRFDFLDKHLLEVWSDGIHDKVGGKKTTRKLISVQSGDSQPAARSPKLVAR